MNRSTKILLAIMAGFMVIQLKQPARNQSGQVSQADKLYTTGLPKNIQMLLQNACFDCHSNNTSYPWYFNIQPVGWILARDIENAKAMLNFNELGSLSSRRQKSKLQDIENRIKDGTMPLAMYQFMHPSARLTNRDREMLLGWIDETKDSLSKHRSDH